MKNKGGVVGIILACILGFFVVSFIFSALIAVPNLAGVRSRSQISADIRTAEQIGKAVRIWATDVDEDVNGEREIPTSPILYSDIEGLVPTYISEGMEARALKGGKGNYYVSSIGTGVNNSEQKIIVGIASLEDVETLTTDGYDKDSFRTVVGFDGTKAAWAYMEH